jgi:hypothetical protein
MRKKELLEAEVKEMRVYASLLDKQKQAIDAGNFDAALAYSDNEAQILGRIADYRKITPVTGENEDTEEEITKLLADLRELQANTEAQNAQNRELLKIQLADTQAQLDALKNPYRNTRSIYADNDGGTKIQIEA